MSAGQQYFEHLLGLKRAEVASDLESQGYDVKTDVQFGAEKVDLVAKKDGRQAILYEFKLPGSLRADSDQIQNIRRIAVQNGYDFRLAVATRPKRIVVGVEGLQNLLQEYLSQRIGSPELPLLASGTTIDEIADIEIESLKVRGNLTDVAGRAVVAVRFVPQALQENGVAGYDNYRLRFDMTLNSELVVESVRSVSIDTENL